MRTPTPHQEPIKVQSLERSLFLLEQLAAGPSPQNLTEISRQSRLSISTTYRLLTTLCRCGFVERDQASGLYHLGLKSFLIGTAAALNLFRPLRGELLAATELKLLEDLQAAVRAISRAQGWAGPLTPTTGGQSNDYLRR